MSNEMLERLRKFAAFFVLVVVCVGCFVYGHVASSADEAVLAKDAEEMQALKTRLDEMRSERTSAVQSVSERVTGVDYNRVANDSVLGEDIAKLVGTWDSLETYQAQREALASKYGLSEDDVLLSTLMPPIEADEVSGYDIITAEGLNGRISNAMTWLVSTDGDTYRYLTDATMLTKAGSNGSTSEFLIMYSTDRSGNVFDTFGTKLF